MVAANTPRPKANKSIGAPQPATAPGYVRKVELNLLDEDKGTITLTLSRGTIQKMVLGLIDQIAGLEKSVATSKEVRDSEVHDIEDKQFFYTELGQLYQILFDLFENYEFDETREMIARFIAV